MDKVRYSTRIERWVTSKGTVTKVAVRSSDGKFHGATNFSGTIIGGK